MELQICNIKKIKDTVEKNNNLPSHPSANHISSASLK